MEQGNTERTAFCIGYAVMPTVGRPLSKEPKGILIIAHV